ncbi:MAG: hypothetical protein LJF15_01350 [Acidobacteria bacterium]|nr:hypothetical protein [Acidobacteriota bacterium]
MSQTLAVAARELRERWLLFPGGLGCGFFPLVLPAFGVPVDLATVVGALGALLLGMSAGLIAGGSMFARDAVDGRLGFLFSRPAAWPAIWGGKWLAAIVLVTGSAALTALPWMLVFPPTSGGSWGEALLDPQGASFVFVLLLLTIGLANLSATVFRSRSVWAALDLGLLLLATWLVWRWVAPLASLVTIGPPTLPYRWRFLVVLGTPALAVVAASTLQVAIGRTDLRRGHRAMSLTFWSVIFVALAAAGLRLAWVRAATPADVGRYASGSLDPSGRWLYLSGFSRRGGGATFLVDTESNHYLPLGTAPHWTFFNEGMAFDAAGRTGALLGHEGEGITLALADLTGDEPRFRTVPLESSPPPDYGTRLALSASGATALVAHPSGVSLFALPSGRRVATATLPPGWRPTAVRMLDESAARVWLGAGFDAPTARFRDEMRVLEVAVDREPRLTAFPLAVALDPQYAWPIPDATGARILTRDGGLRLRDGATGALLATLVETAAPGAAAFVADGRIVVGEASGAQTLIHVFAPDGTPLGEGSASLDRVPMGLSVGPEMAPGQVAVFFAPLPFQADALIFDIDEGRVVETLSEGRPLGGGRLRPPTPGTGTMRPWARLFMEGDDVVRLDVATGERRVVAGPDARPGGRIRPADVGLD